MFAQQMQCLFSGSSRNLLAMQISFPVSFCQNNKFCQISLSVVSCLSLFSVEFLLTVSFFGSGLANILQDSNAQILVFLCQVGRFNYIRLSTKYGLKRKFSCMFELLVENSLASKPNVWLARFDLLRQISYRVETLLESFLDYYCWNG